MYYNIHIWDIFKLYRIACNYFVLGVEKYTADLLEEAADLLTMSYIVNDRITKDEVTNIPVAAPRPVRLHEKK